MSLYDELGKPYDVAKRLYKHDDTDIPADALEAIYMMCLQTVIQTKETVELEDTLFLTEQAWYMWKLKTGDIK